MADSVVELNVVPNASKLRQFDEAKEAGDRVQEEFILHCRDAGWTVLDFTAESKRFRDKRGAPIAVNNDGDIKLPDYGISKQPYYPATTLPSLYCEIKGETPYTHKDGQRYYYYDDWRWDYFEEVCNHFGFAGLMVFKKKPHEKTNLDNFYCISRERARHSIVEYSFGGNDRCGNPVMVYKWDPKSFTPLRDILYGELVSPIRHTFELKTNGKWIEV